MAENSDLDQVWLVVTPHNPFKKKAPCSMTTIACKWHLATEDFPKLKPSDIEFKLSQPNYTVNTLVHLEEKYPNHEFSLIMGKDNLTSLSKWKILKLFCKIMIYVYPRIEAKDRTGEVLSSESESSDLKITQKYI
jgi:nicotinate-nucleotide adenylyltransferase